MKVEVERVVQIFIQPLADNGRAPYFDFKDAPNFVASLKRARGDAAALRPMPRLSTWR